MSHRNTDDTTANEHFLALDLTCDEQMAHRKASVLENAGIPVLIEHIHIVEGSLQADGYRLMVPSKFVQNAKRLLRYSDLFILN